MYLEIIIGNKLIRQMQTEAVFENIAERIVSEIEKAEDKHNKLEHQQHK